MKAIIFAAGLGTRLRPLTNDIPKPLLDVGGKTILARTLEALPASVDQAVVVTGYKGEMIRAALAEGREGLKVSFVDQPALKGTYDALLRARSHVRDGEFLALNGDDLYAREDLEALAAAKPFAMLTKTVRTPNAYSHLETERGLLRRIVLNRDSADLPARRIYTGGCLLDRRFFTLPPASLLNGELSLPHTLEKHLNIIPVHVVDASFWMPVGTPEELQAARAFYAGR